MLFSLDAVRAIQGDGQWAPLMRLLTLLGNEEFFLLLVPLVYSCISPSLGLRLGVLVIGGDALNNLCKLCFALPRPYWLNNLNGHVLELAQDTSFGLPSSHAQNATAVWGLLALQSRRAWAWAVAALLIGGISLSRVYLGVHFPLDVVAGWMLGALWLVVVLQAERHWGEMARGWSAGGKIGIVTMAVVAVWMLGWMARSASWHDATGYTRFLFEARSPDALARSCGALWGLGLGWALGGAQSFDASGTWGIRLARFGVALVGIGLIWGVLGRLLPHEPMPREMQLIGLIFRFARYALLTWWVVDGAPRLWLRLRLTRRQEVLQ